MKNYSNKLFSFILLFGLLWSCEVTELDLVTDPNAPSPENLDVDFTLNSIQLSFGTFFEEATEAGGEAVRLEYMFDEYDVNFNSTYGSTTVMWRTAYAGILPDIKVLIPVAEESTLFVHSGIAKVLRAYVLMTLVDYFGDVPYSDALLGTEGFFPTLDSGQDVYDAALTDLNDALADFGKDSASDPDLDLYYDGDIDSWINLTNSLKLKYYLNLRLSNPSDAAANIASLIGGGNIITGPEDDFKFTYGTAQSPLSKHPYYIEEYQAASPGEYITNYMMWALGVEKGLDDPRQRYYVYRQVSEFPTDPATLNNEIDCWNDPRPATYAPVDAISPVPLAFCSLFGRGDGYWGRNHGNADGIPPDNQKRSTFGPYPVGGRYDDNDAEAIDDGDGLDGAGIWPIMMDSFVYFMRAEAALYLGTSDDPRAMLEQGVRSSIATVTGFLNTDNFDNVPDDADTEAYVAFVLALYDAAGTADERMAVVGKEYWIALFGNGVEGSNLLKRSGTPINLSPTLLGTTSFPRTFLYPAESVDRNLNISQKALTDQTFWDTNAPGFIY